MPRQVRLLAAAVTIAPAVRATGEFYDPLLDYSVAPSKDGLKPVAEIAISAQTMMSKTKTDPGDDDADPDDERCY